MTTAHPTSVRLDDELKKDLQKLAKADSRSLSGYIELVLKKHVEAVKARSAKR